LKPISTLRSSTGNGGHGDEGAGAGAYERSDWCVVPAGGVAGEAMVALV